MNSDHKTDHLISWQDALRKITSSILVLLFILFGYAALTEPAFSATTPAVLTVGCAVMAYLLWPKGRV